MFKKMNSFILKFKSFLNGLQEDTVFRPSYRVVELIQNEDEVYIATIQVIQKNITFNIQPEELLANDDMVDLFSPRDIRTLTYLGYLGVNAPKYKILAQRLSEDNEELVFALKKKGQKKPIIKTAAEIMKEKDIMHSLPPKDIHSVGYLLANESFNREKRNK